MKASYQGLPRFCLSLLAAAIASASGAAMAQQMTTSQNSEASVDLNDITVTADEVGPVGPDVGYKAERSLTGTKTDTPLSKTPRSVSVATRERIKDLNAQTLADVLQYMPGVSTTKFPVGDSLAGDIFYIRGVNQRDYGYGIYRDGLRVQPNAYSTSAEPYGLERVELFKGPTSILYGENVPGGLVNLVSKRPTYARQGEVNVTYGTHNRKQVTTDVSGRLTEDGDVQGRLVMLYREADTQTEGVPDDRFYIAPSLTLKPTERDTLTLLAQYQNDDTEIQLGLPAAGTLLDHPEGKLDRDANIGDPDWDAFDREFWSLGYEYEHAFNDAWRFRQNARYTRSLVDRQETWWSFPPAIPAGLLPQFPDGARGDGFDSFVLAYGRDRHNESRVYSLDNQLVGDFQTGALNNTLLLGLSYDKLSFAQTQRVSERPDLATGQLNEYQVVDIFDPQRSTPTRASVLSSDDEIKQDLIGGYAQLQTELDGLIGLIGGRYDWAQSETEDNLTPDNSYDQTDKEFTWQAGVMYQFDNGVSPYVSYSTSFVPLQQIRSLTTGETFDPITGEQYEVGVKFAPEDLNTSITLAAYRLDKNDDVIFSDGDWRQVGKTESEGVELEVVSDLSESLSLTAAYTYTDARIAEDEGSRFEDRQIVGVPRHQASLWASYRFLDGALDGLQTGVGLRYLGSSYAYAPESVDYGTLETDDETLVDMALGYRLTDNWSARVDVKNLFDEEFVGECNNAGRCYWGAERTVQGTVSYNW